MPVELKLLTLLFFNIAALMGLLGKLIRRGNSFAGSLKLAWDLIIGEPGEHAGGGIYPSVIWVPVLRKTWWLTIFLFAIYWLIAQDFFAGVTLALLIVFHGVWYLYAALSLKIKYDRILHLNSHWGIIYKEIREDSELNQKSLAELDLRKKNLLVLAIERNGQINSFPKGLEVIQTGDRVIMFGEINAYQVVFE